MMEIVCTITGTVQGVRYRAYVEEAATALGVVGSIANLPTGQVEVCAQGDPDTLKAFIEHLWEGSLQARVEGVDVVWQQPRATCHEFSVLH